MKVSPMRHHLRAQNAPQRRGLPVWLYLLCGFGVLIIVQGALRKWMFPDFSAPLYIAKDVVLLGALWGFFDRYGFRLPSAAKQSMLPYLWGGLAIIVCLQAFNLRVPSVGVGLLGIRSYLLYSVLLVMMPMALQHVRNSKRVVTVLGLVVVAPVLTLGFYQYTMPIDHWINRYVNVGASIDRLADDPRITGTFSYVSGMGTFLVFALGFGTAISLAGIRRRDRYYQVLGIMLLGFALVVAPMNGSRSVVFGVFLAVPFALYRALQGGRRSSIILGACVLVIGFGYIGTQTEFATQGWEAFQYRVETSETEGRVESMLQDPLEKTHIFLGYGAGSTHVGARALSAEGTVQIPGIDYEEEPGRVIIELGLIGGVVFLCLKLWILWMTWDGMKRAKNSWEDIICMTAFIVAFLHTTVEKIVFNHVGGSIYWLCVGAALWVWSRRVSASMNSLSSPETVKKRA